MARIWYNIKNITLYICRVGSAKHLHGGKLIKEEMVWYLRLNLIDRNGMITGTGECFVNAVHTIVPSYATNLAGPDVEKSVWLKKLRSV